MKRLIYAPKAYVFVRSSNLDGRIFDVSSDVVSGSVTRVQNEISKADFVLRNRFKKWLKDPDSGKSIFLPMDLVTIWLQRVAGKPIQVFTGYLDSAPYYQIYPGNARFTASCTLKKLAYTWFDPGLDFFTSFVNSMEGWIYNPHTGEAKNPEFLTTGENVNDQNFKDAGASANMHDGGFGKLLNDFLVLAGGWSQKDVIVSDLPAHLPKVAARLWGEINTQTEAALEQLERDLGQIMGLSVSVPDIDTDEKAEVVTPKAQTTVAEIKKGNGEGNVPLILLVFAALALTNFKDTYSVGKGVKADEARWGYGLYALRPKSVLAGNRSGSPFGVSLSDDTIEGYTLAQIADATNATKAFVTKLNRATGPWVAQAKKNDRAAMVTWITKALGRPIPEQDLANIFENAKRYAGVSKVVTGQAPVAAVSPANFTFDDPRIWDKMTSAEKKVYWRYYGPKANQWLSTVLHWGKAIRVDLELSGQKGMSRDEMYVTGLPGSLKALFNALANHPEIDFVYLDAGTTMALKKGVRSSETQKNVPAGSLYVRWSTKPLKQGEVAAKETQATEVAATEATLSFDQLAAFSANAAFAANFSFPTNYLESKSLTGDKALMNDTSMLDATTQFCQASMRNFMSLPDGRFLAFYPDYFGTVRGPYWWIHDVEIINMGIQINDESLATHVYVTGDTFAIDGQVNWMDRVSSRGVAAITHAFMLESFIEDYNETKTPLGRLQDANTFLQHYGARPHKEESPIIRNAFYEFLLAWQRFMTLWASQFATEVDFTFQPELFAGGIVAFPDHDLQMYIEQVTHTFDYESGFSTQAVLSSPSLLQGKRRDDWQKPGFALAGNVNTVGGRSG